MQPKPTLKEFFAENRDKWANGQIRPDARAAIEKALKCRTLALGAEVYESSNGERMYVCHTCKSKACPSCGWWATLRRQDEITSKFPNIPYAGVGFTMPSIFWPIFQQNRHLLDHLPAIGAGVLQDWAMQQYSARVIVLVVLHTFKDDLTFDPHLHILISTVGLHKGRRRLVSELRFSAGAVTQIWRHTLLDYLSMSLHAGHIRSDVPKAELAALFTHHHDALWIPYVRYYKSKDAFIRYITRYLCRSPLAEYRLLSTIGSVRFKTKDKKQEVWRVTEYSSPDFISRYTDQVPDRYKHGMHYFGLVAPKSIKYYKEFMALLGQKIRRKPKHLPWDLSIERTSGTNPLADSKGERRHRVGRIAPEKR